MELERKGGRPTGYAKTGGRQRGTPNKARQDVRERLVALGCDPIDGLARIIKNPEATLELQRGCFNDLLPYGYSKLKPVDVSTEQSTVMNVITNLDSSPDSDDDNQPT